MKVWLLALAVACRTPAEPPHNRATPDPPALELTWVVHPADPTEDYPGGYPLDLVVGTQTIALEKQIGRLVAPFQSVCLDDPQNPFALAHDEVAKITFEEGGFGGYVVKRSSPRGLALISWSQSDGMCTDATDQPTECPRHDKEVRLLDVPVDVKVRQHLVMIDNTGKQTPFDCKAE